MLFLAQFAITIAQSRVFDFCFCRPLSLTPALCRCFAEAMQSGLNENGKAQQVSLQIQFVV